MLRRTFLTLPSLSAGFVLARPKIDEYDPANIKLSHRMVIRTLNDEDLQFLRQLGIRW